MAGFERSWLAWELVRRIVNEFATYLKCDVDQPTLHEHGIRMDSNRLPTVSDFILAVKPINRALVCEAFRSTLRAFRLSSDP